mgnify:CR=1 FL=1
MLQVKRPMSQSYIVGLLLAFAGGYLDVYTYVCRGGVFANAQTGNMVLLAISAAENDFGKVFKYLLSILAFMLGILVTELVKSRYRYNTAIHWRQIVIALEFIVLLIIAFVPSGVQDDLVNIAVAFGCAIQVESFRKFEGKSAYATTMCTGNLRSATEHLFFSGLNKNKEERNTSLKYYGIIAIFIVGAFVSMKVSQSVGEKSILVACFLLFIVFSMMYIPSEKQLSQ